MTLDRAVFAVDSYTREIAYVLIGTCELVEEGSLAAVLIAYECKSQKSPFRQWIACSLRVKTSAFAESRMLRLQKPVCFCSGQKL